MPIYHISEANKAPQLDQWIQNGNNHVFVLVFMDGCGPCEATKPEWKKMADSLSDSLDPSVHLVDLNQKVMSGAQSIQGVTGFPTIKHFHQGSSSDYEGDRSAQALTEWIRSKSGGSKSHHGGKRKRRGKRTKRRTRRQRRGRRTKSR